MKIRSKGKLLALAVLAVTVVGFTLPAHADPHGRDGGWHDREVHAHGWYHHHRWRPGYVPPPVVYGPPAVVYPPPEPSPGINLIVPLNLR